MDGAENQRGKTEIHGALPFASGSDSDSILSAIYDVRVAPPAGGGTGVILLPS